MVHWGIFFLLWDGSDTLYLTLMGELLSVFRNVGADWSRDIDSVLYESITCKWGVEIIAVTSWHHCVSYYRQLDSPLKIVFRLTTKRIPMSVTGPLWREPSLTGRFPSQSASNMRNVSWRHHDLSSFPGPSCSSGGSGRRGLYVSILLQTTHNW